jgi:hypothetical protein
LNAFNLVLAGVTYTKLMPMLGISGMWATVGLVIFPGAYSLAFFGLGLWRWLKDLKGKGAYQRKNMRLGIYRLLFNRKRPIKIPGDERAIADSALGSWSAEELTKEASTIAEAIRGEAEIGDDGRVVIRAQRIWDEMKTAEDLRRRTDGSSSIGRTIFRSADPALDPPSSEEVELAEQIAELEVGLDA